jgi:hypothetical protein
MYCDWKWTSQDKLHLHHEKWKGKICAGKRKTIK